MIHRKGKEVRRDEEKERRGRVVIAWTEKREEAFGKMTRKRGGWAGKGMLVERRRTMLGVREVKGSSDGIVTGRSEEVLKDGGKEGKEGVGGGREDVKGDLFEWGWKLIGEAIGAGFRGVGDGEEGAREGELRKLWEIRRKDGEGKLRDEERDGFMEGPVVEGR
ncbi:hypothetical protein Tco_0973738 [Tanacetum coccineum]|uniref:Uncharacterized protein n=1 Tax=Tanacetum coccineum TaxID=301880 RepID=A0ABQ5E9L7_9ASTR